ncbi:MAG: DUF302 domain-containing protein [Verrucomicrobia bacterium]|nr:MAG: DUF302 domain-containing protein [Verrucomicrobiota bacterium]
MGERLAAAAQRHKFGVLGMHNLKEKMASKGVEFDREVRVFDVCNPQQAKDVLSNALEVSTVLPCRISAFERDGKTVLAMVRPTRLLNLFDLPGMEETAQSVEDTLAQIMHEAAAD